MAFTSDNLRVFLAVLDHGSFSAAARALGRVPSAVSMTIMQLEAELDLALFDRIGREPKPTEAARALEPQARKLSSELLQLNAHALAMHQGLERRLTLAIAPELLMAHWSDPLASLASEFPALEVKIRSAPQADSLQMLHDGDVQLALVFERPAMDDREAFMEVSAETFVAVLAPSHPLAPQAAGHLKLDDLLDERQIVVASRDGEESNPRLVVSRRPWQTDSYLASMRLVQSGLGWAFLPKVLVQPLVDAGTLIEIAFGNVTNQLNLWVDVVWSKERPLGLGARRYIELLREAAPSPSHRKDKARPRRK